MEVVDAINPLLDLLRVWLHKGTDLGHGHLLLLLEADELHLEQCGIDGVDCGFVLQNEAVDTRVARPSTSSLSSGFGTLRKASTSPMAGMYSGMKGRNLASSSML